MSRTVIFKNGNRRHWIETFGNFFCELDAITHTNHICIFRVAFNNFITDKSPYQISFQPQFFSSMSNFFKNKQLLFCTLYIHGGKGSEDHSRFDARLEVRCSMLTTNNDWLSTLPLD